MADPVRIKPFVEELSLAYDPANRKKFFMRKDQSKGGNNMSDKLKEILQKGISNEAGFVTALEKAGLDSETRENVLGAMRILAFYKDKATDELAGMVKDLGITWIPKPPEAPDMVKLKKDVETELRPVLEKEIRTELGKDESEIVKELKKEIGTFRDELKKAKDEANKATEKATIEYEARRFGELKKELADGGIPGNVNDTAKTILLLEKTNPEQAKDVLKTVLASGEMLKSKGIFVPVGGIGEGELNRGSAMQKIAKLVKEKMEKNPELAEPTAWQQVIRENKELYKEYQKETNKK